jgi:hypothetical protein
MCPKCTPSPEYWVPDRVRQVPTGWYWVIPVLNVSISIEMPRNGACWWFDSTRLASTRVAKIGTLFRAILLLFLSGLHSEKRVCQYKPVKLGRILVLRPSLWTSFSRPCSIWIYSLCFVSVFSVSSGYIFESDCQKLTFECDRIALTVAFSLIGLGLNAYFISLTVPYFYFIFSALGVATAVLTILTVPIMCVCLCLGHLDCLSSSQVDRWFYTTRGVHFHDCLRTLMALYVEYSE